jgi:septal ring factor EnvC (AmiA/AmiB activator)
MKKMNTPIPSAITNEMLYEFLKEFKAEMRDFKTDVNRRFEQVDKRFEQIEKRFEQVDKQFEQVNERFKQVDKRFNEMFDLIREERNERENNEDKLEKIYESRDRVSVNFTRLWAVASFFIAILSSVVTLTIDRIFVK